MSHKLEDIIRTVHQCRGDVFIEIKNGEVVAVFGKVPILITKKETPKK